MSQNSSPLNRKAMLVSVGIKYWGGQKGDTRINQAAADRFGNRTDAIHARKRMLDSNNPKVAAVRRAKNALRKEVYNQTLPWGDGGPAGQRLLPSKNYWSFKEKIDALSAAYEDACTSMVQDYDNLLAAAAQANGRLFRREEFPGKAEMERLYGVEVKFKEVPSGDDLRVTLGDDEEARIRAQIDGDVREAYKEAQLEEWSRLYENVKHLSDRLKAYDPDDKKAAPFRDSTIKNVRDMVETLERLNIGDDPRLETMRKAVQEQLTSVDAKELREDDAERKATIDKADDILATMDDYLAADTA